VVENRSRAGHRHRITGGPGGYLSRIAVDDAFTPGGPRRTPRKSLIVVLPDNHVVAPDLVTDRMSDDGESETDVILACAGQPMSIGALQRSVRDLQVLLAPPGTSSEDLRELAMQRAPGDVVTLLTGTPVQA
jgi:hypothetical protein